MKYQVLTFLTCLLVLSPLPADESRRTLFKFDDAATVGRWQTVNDGVMGGRSFGQKKINGEQNLVFFGTLSLQNNGGFASVRAADAGLALRNDEVVVLRVRGDGRKYNLNLYADGSLSGYSYRQSFQTIKGRWVEVELPVNQFGATWRGRKYPNQKLDPAKVSGLGILLGDKQPGPFNLEVQWIKAGPPRPVTSAIDVRCDGIYTHHLQGVSVDDQSIYWSFTTTLVKTDMAGTVLNRVPVVNHHGDLVHHQGKLYVAVNLGKFNDPLGNADSWIYVYDANTLKELSRVEVPEVFHGAGGIGFRGDHFFVVGGLPDELEENYVYEYDRDFKFVTKHVIASGHTHLGIQTATFAHDRWWFGCYGDPKTMLVTDSAFQLKGRSEYDCSLGIAGLPQGRLLVASGRCDKNTGCTGRVRTANPKDLLGVRSSFHKP